MKYLKYTLAIILVLVLFFFAKGLFTPTVSYECEVMVNKEVKESWAVMSDKSILPEWIKGFIKMEHVSGTENTIGAVSRIYAEEGGQEMVMEETITNVIPEELIAMTFTMDFMDMDYEMLVSEEDGKTLIKSRSTTKGNGIFAKSIVSFMKGSMKKQEVENLNTLKRIIEKNTKNYFPEARMEAISQ